MFNQLRPSDIVGAIGVTARDAARSDDAADDFARAQLMSAYSATRHLAVELSSFAPEFEAFRTAVARRVRASVDRGATSLDAAATALERETGVAGVGGALSDLLAALRDDGGPEAAALRSDLQVLLRALADREVDLLADALDRR